MRKTFLILASITALFLLAPFAPAQSVPDAPQPQKKTTPKAQTTPATDSSETPAASSDKDASPDAQPAGPPAAAGKDNAFPEDVSRAAARSTGNAEGSQAQGTNDQANDQASSGKPAKNDNAFPEDVSRAAAKAAQESQKGSEDQPLPPRSLSPGESSSQSSSSSDSTDVMDAPANVIDPIRAKKDLEVGTFYLKTGEFKGALLRYKDATASDPTNVEAIYGLAEAQRGLKNNAEAIRNYELYLAIVPDGPKARQSLKALKTLQSQP